MLFYFDNTKKNGGGEVTFYNSGHRLVLGHMNNMRCLGKVHAPANYRRRPEFEIPQIYLSDVNHSFMMQGCILVPNFVCSVGIKHRWASAELPRNRENVNLRDVTTVVMAKAILRLKTLAFIPS